MSDDPGEGRPPAPNKVPNLADVIARAIRAADTRYFFEDYDRQAEAVIRALRENGFVMVPQEPSEPMLEAGSDALRYGRVNKFSTLRAIYKAMIQQRPDRDRNPLKAIARRMTGR